MDYAEKCFTIRNSFSALSSPEIFLNPKFRNPVFYSIRANLAVNSSVGLSNILPLVARAY